MTKLQSTKVTLYLRDNLSFRGLDNNNRLGNISLLNYMFKHCVGQVKQTTEEYLDSNTSRSRRMVEMVKRNFIGIKDITDQNEYSIVATSTN